MKLSISKMTISRVSWSRNWCNCFTTQSFAKAHLATASICSSSRKCESRRTPKLPLILYGLVQPHLEQERESPQNQGPPKTKATHFCNVELYPTVFHPNLHNLQTPKQGFQHHLAGQGEDVKLCTTKQAMYHKAYLWHLILCCQIMSPSGFMEMLRSR